MTTEPHPRSFRRVWLWPIGIALLSAAGLVSALLGDGAWDAASWVALAPPILLSGMAWRRSRRGAG
jgi:hypothetical protein